MKALRDRLAAALADSYRIERELGGGGMSLVFLAQETALSRPVVIKVVAPELTEGLSAERFAREMKLAARLQQANIVPVLSAGVADGVPYYTMPFVKGESLRARMAGGAPIGLAESVGILRDVARALAYAHSEGIVHRDIKPDNVLLSHGTAVVTDFGIAKALTASRTQDRGVAATLTQAGGSIGTPAYMAPEQAVGEAVDHRSDLYAFGVMAYELLSGAHPFVRHTTPQQLIGAHITETPVTLSGKNAAVPPALAALVMRCLEKQPGARPDSAAEVLAVLDTVTTPVPSGTITATPAPRRIPGKILAGGSLLVAALTVWLLTRRGANPAVESLAQQSLAVLPFESVGGDTANAYFAEGIADELTTALAQLPGLRLAGRSSAMQFKGKGASAQEIGTALKVGSILEGTVRRAAGRVRVTAQLTGASNGLVLWSESYDRETKDVFALQDDITRAIVAALSVRLAAAPGRGASASGTTNPEAHDLYLRGLYFFRRRGAALTRAAEYFEQAIARDSSFARPHAALAMTLLTEPYYLPVRVGDMLPRARAAAQRAAALDPELSEAHMALGLVAFHSFQWAKSEAEYRRAIALDPSSADAHYRFGFTLFTEGRNSEAIAEFEQAKALDPLYSIVAAYLGWARAIAGHADVAVAEAKRAVELDSALVANQTILSLTSLEAGDLAEARATAERAVTMTDDGRRLGWMAYVLTQTGEVAKARATVTVLEAMPETGPRRAAGLALAYVGLKDTARALTSMEQAAAGDGDLLLAIVPSSRAWDPVRQSPRFSAVLRRFNLDVARFTAPDGGRSR